MKAALYILLFSCCLSFSAHSQAYEYVYRHSTDSSYNCYIKYIPNSDSIKGLVVRDYSSLYDASSPSPYQFTQLALEAGLMVLITNTSPSYPELFTSHSTIALLDTIIHEVMAQHLIPKENLFIGGISASGTRALRYAQHCAQGFSDLSVRGVFAVDPPLDLARFYTSVHQNSHLFKGGMQSEAQLMKPWFIKEFGGSPKEKPEAYRQASVFSHSDSTGGNARFLAQTDLLLFHEPDIDWWMEERGCSYFDFNSFDLAAFVVLLQHLGNEEVQLISTSQKGFDRAGNRKPHSWTIVDETYLLQWILARME